MASGGVVAGEPVAPRDHVSEGGERRIAAPDAVMLYDPWGRARVSIRPSELDALRTLSGRGLPVGQLQGAIDSLTTLTRLQLRDLTPRGTASAGATEWIVKGWGRPRAFLDWVLSSSPSWGHPPAGPPPVIDRSWDRLRCYRSIVRLMTRRSGLRFSTEPVHERAIEDIESTVRAAQLRSPWLSCGLVYQTCAGREPGVYRLRSGDAALDRVSGAVPEEDLLALCQGQRWILGGGLVVFLGFDPSWVERHRPIPSAWYLSCLAAIGRTGQLLVAGCHDAGLVARMTPALDEAIAARAFAAPADAEFCYLLKLAMPAEQQQ